MTKLAMSIEEAGEALGGLSPWTIRKYISEGKIRTTRPGGGRRVMIEPSELQRLVEEGRQPGEKRQRLEAA